MKKNEKGLPFLAAVEVGEELYYSTWLKNGLFKMNQLTRKITYIGRVWEEQRETNLHKFAFHYKNYIYFIPSYAQYIAKLCLDSLSISVLNIPVPEKSRPLSKFSDIVSIGNTLWLIPYAYGAILKVDLETDQIAEFDNWPSEILDSGNCVPLFRGGVHTSNNLCICPYEGKDFITFDLEKHDMKSWRWKFPAHAFCKMILHENVIWFLPENDYPYIIGYDLGTDEEIRIKTNDQIGNDIVAMYSDAIVVGDYIVVLPCQSDHWMLLNVKSKEIVRRKVTNVERFKGKEYPRYQAANYFSEGFIATKDIDESGVYFANDSFNPEAIQFIMDDEILCDYMWDIMFHSGISKERNQSLIEDTDGSFDTYLRLLCEHRGQKDNKGWKGKNFGSEIYQKVRQQ